MGSRWRAALGLMLFVAVAGALLAGCVIGALCLAWSALFGGPTPQDAVNRLTADLHQVRRVRSIAGQTIRGDGLSTAPEDGIVTVTLDPRTTARDEVVAARTITAVVAKDQIPAARLHVIVRVGRSEVGVSANPRLIGARVKLARGLTRVTGVASARVLWHQVIANDPIPDSGNRSLNVTAVTAAGVAPAAEFDRLAAVVEAVSPHASLVVEDRPTADLVVYGPNPGQAVHAIVSRVTRPPSSAVSAWLSWVAAQPGVVGYLTRLGGSTVIVVSSPQAEDALTAAIDRNPPPGRSPYPPRVTQLSSVTGW